MEIADEVPFILHPGEFVLASTFEHIELPEDLVARLEARARWGRIGLLIHSTAGYVDPGWKGHLTLELSNVANLPVTLYYGMKIGQLSYLRLTTPVDNLYGSPALGSKYQGQTEPTASRAYQDVSLRRVVMCGGFDGPSRPSPLWVPGLRRNDGWRPPRGLTPRIWGLRSRWLGRRSGR